MIKRLDAKTPGIGAAKAREVLTAHGLKRIRDADEATAGKLIAAYNAIQ
jgi:hypothetical protein